MAKLLSETLLKRPATKGPFSDYRQQAYALFQQTGLPHRRLDQWKYINSDFLMEQKLLQHHRKNPWQSNYRNEVVQLYYNQPKNVNSGCLAVVEDQVELRSAALEEESNVFALINGFTFSERWYLDIPAHLPALQINFASGKEEYLAPRLRIRLGAGQQTTLFLNWSALADSSYCNALIEFELEADSKLRVVDYGAAVEMPLQNSTFRYCLQQNAELHSSVLITTAGLHIHDSRVDLLGEQATVELQGLSLLRQQQRLHLHTAINHLVGNTRSRQLFKNILFDRSCSEYTGLVYAAPYADGTDSNQQNRNLLMSKWAHALARPQLNINAEDLQCNHGSSTGSLAAAELFYLQSRGVSPAVARLLLTEGFTREVLDNLPKGAPTPDYSTLIATSLAETGEV